MHSQTERNSDTYEKKKGKKNIHNSPNSLAKRARQHNKYGIWKKALNSWLPDMPNDEMQKLVFVQICLRGVWECILQYERARDLSSLCLSADGAIACHFHIRHHELSKWPPTSAFSCSWWYPQGVSQARYLHAKQVRPLSLEGVSYFCKGGKGGAPRWQVEVFFLNGALVFGGGNVILWPKNIWWNLHGDPLYFWTAMPWI